MPRLKEATRKLKQKALINLYAAHNGNQAAIARAEGVSPPAINQRIHNKTIDVTTRLMEFLDKEGFSIEDYIGIIVRKLNELNGKDHAKYCGLFQDMIPGLKAAQKVESTHKVLPPTNEEEEEYRRLKSGVCLGTTKEEVNIDSVVDGVDTTSTPQTLSFSESLA